MSTPNPVPVIDAAAVREVNALLEQQHELLRDIALTAQDIKEVMVATLTATAEVCANVGHAIELHELLVDLSVPHAHPGGPPEPSTN